MVIPRIKVDFNNVITRMGDIAGNPNRIKGPVEKGCWNLMEAYDGEGMAEYCVVRVPNGKWHWAVLLPFYKAIQLNEMLSPNLNDYWDDVVPPKFVHCSRR